MPALSRISSTTFIFFFLVFLSRFSNAQETAAVADTSLPPGVMLIPYDPLYYLSDADHDIAEQTPRAMKEVRQTFHEKADYYVYAAISRQFRCTDLLHDTSDAVQEDLVTVFSTLGYRYEDPMNINPDARKLQPENQKKDSYEDPQTAYRYKNPEPNLKYMHAVLGKPGLLKALSDKYHTDYFVFLNQFEIKTNYNSCIDIANKVYQRTLLLHFSIYDKYGKQLAGNFAYAFFPSKTGEANEIMKNCFPVLGSGIAKSLADAVASSDAGK